MQKDVADKILDGTKSDPKNSFLSLLMQKKATMQFIRNIEPTSFRPQPKVRSSVLFFKIQNEYDSYIDDDFIDTLKIAFSNNRKKTIKNFVQHWYKKETIEKIFDTLWIQKDLRPEKITLIQYLNLSRKLSKKDL